MKKIILWIVIAVSIIFVGFMIFNLSNKKAPTLQVDSSSNNSSANDITPATSSTVQKNATIYIVNENGDIKETSAEMKNNDYEGFLKKIIFEYNNRQDVSIKNDIKVTNYDKKMGTLYINLSNGFDCKYDSPKKQQLVIDSIIKSFLSIENKDFEDVQFVVNGESKNNIFGDGYDTENPLKR